MAGGCGIRGSPSGQRAGALSQTQLSGLRPPPTTWTPLPNSSTQQAARMVELQAEGTLPLHPWSYPCRQRLRMGFLCCSNPHPDRERGLHHRHAPGQLGTGNQVWLTGTGLSVGTTGTDGAVSTSETMKGACSPGQGTQRHVWPQATLPQGPDAMIAPNVGEGGGCPTWAPRGNLQEVLLPRSGGFSHRPAGTTNQRDPCSSSRRPGCKTSVCPRSRTWPQAAAGSMGIVITTRDHGPAGTQGL